LVVTFTHRIVDARQRSWMDIPKEWSLKDIMPIIREVPDAKYFMVNAANSMVVNDDDTDLLRRTNILIDTSGRNLTNLGEMILRLGKDKFAMGTHFPILDYLGGILRIESLRENEADGMTKQLLRSGNAGRVLSL